MRFILLLSFFIGYASCASICKDAACDDFFTNLENIIPIEIKTKHITNTITSESASSSSSSSSSSSNSGSSSSSETAWVSKTKIEGGKTTSEKHIKAKAKESTNEAEASANKSKKESLNTVKKTVTEDGKIIDNVDMGKKSSSQSESQSQSANATNKAISKELHHKEVDIKIVTHCFVTVKVNLVFAVPFTTYKEWKMMFLYLENFVHQVYDAERMSVLIIFYQEEVFGTIDLSNFRTVEQIKDRLRYYFKLRRTENLPLIPLSCLQKYSEYFHKFIYSSTKNEIKNYLSKATVFVSLISDEFLVSSIDKIDTQISEIRRAYSRISGRLFFVVVNIGEPLEDDLGNLNKCGNPCLQNARLSTYRYVQAMSRNQVANKYNIVNLTKKDDFKEFIFKLTDLTCRVIKQ